MDANNMVHKVDCCDLCFEKRRFAEETWGVPQIRMYVNNKGFNLCLEHMEEFRDELSETIEKIKGGTPFEKASVKNNTHGGFSLSEAIELLSARLEGDYER